MEVLLRLLLLLRLTVHIVIRLIVLLSKARLLLHD